MDASLKGKWECIVEPGECQGGLDGVVRRGRWVEDPGSKHRWYYEANIGGQRCFRD